MTINYEEGQIITLYEKTKDKWERIYDIFPPMMFCKAATDQSRKYICHAYSFYRRGITVDHPLGVWLMDNSVQLNQYFQRQFSQIIDCLCEGDAEDIIQKFDDIRRQLISLTDHHGVDISSLPQLSMDDFWSEKDEECPF